MSTNQFYELYADLATLRIDPSNCDHIIDKLTLLCRETITSSSLKECLLAADNCLQEISNSTSLFAIALSCWLTDDDYYELAKALADKASVNYLQVEYPLAYDLSALDESRAILTACRLCALDVSPAISLGWVLSLVTAYPASATALNAARALTQHHTQEYPLTTQRLLASPKSPFTSLGIAKMALAELEQQQNHLDTLPVLRELTMSPEMRLMYASLKRSENREIQRHSEAHSIFGLFVTKQHFKYANKTAVEFAIGDDVKETTLEMISLQVRVELPLTWSTDPLSAGLTRKRLWGGDLK
ncbi:TPA: hypothetical protein QIW90_002764 [Klebsiella variicola]|uniref:hypothetical protein n=1 Tax=Klebsiella variicola TaxID=244366 RepID=UPI0027F95757|nr:hypothetical protein [Klebsiella variicola]HDU3538131.1 hypothetical protein [Klebsiella variicola]